MNNFSRFPHGAARRAAFTLIELLTVIAIIGILAAIPIPTVGAVRQSANSSACVSNLRQMGVAFQLYAEANKNRLPPAQSNDEAWPRNTWMYSLQPYLERRQAGSGQTNVALCFDGLFRCPGKTDWNIAGPDVYRISYGMSTFDTIDQGEASRAIARLLTLFKQPSITMLAMDKGTLNAAGAQGHLSTHIINRNYIYNNPIALRHKGKDNVLFLDGHVEALPRDGLNYFLMKSESNTVKPF